MLDHSESGVLNYLSNHEILTPEEKASLFSIYQNTEDPAVRVSILNKLIKHDFRLARKIATKYFSEYLDQISELELVQEGLFFGYLKALQWYNPNKNCNETSYLVKWIRSAMGNFIFYKKLLVSFPQAYQVARVFWERARNSLKEKDSTLNDLEIYQLFISLKIQSLQKYRLKKGEVLSEENAYAHISPRFKKRDDFIFVMHQMDKSTIRDSDDSDDNDEQGANSSQFSSNIEKPLDDLLQQEEIELAQGILNGEIKTSLLPRERQVLRWYLGSFRISEFTSEQIALYRIEDRKSITFPKIAQMLKITPEGARKIYLSGIRKLRIRFFKEED